MHLGHDHHHHNHGGAGHNGSAPASQWQTPHLPAGAERPDAVEPDLDLVEDAFVGAFPNAPDPTSFLRLAGVPFVGEAVEGGTLSLLRVEIGQTTDIGTLTPRVGGAGHRYDPLPAKLTSQRQTLAFAYFDGTAIVRLSLAEARALRDITPKR